MTINQLAVAAGSDLKWLQNASAILKRDLHPTPREAKLWSLIRVLVAAMDISLKAAFSIASKALRMEHVGVQCVITSDDGGVASIVLDLPRFESIFNANLSCALILETPRQRGRPKIQRGNAIERATRYGIDVSLLQSALHLSVAERLERLNANAEFLRQLRVSR